MEGMQVDDEAEGGCDVDKDRIHALATADLALGFVGPGFGFRLQPEGSGSMLTLATDLRSPTAEGSLSKAALGLSWGGPGVH